MDEAKKKAEEEAAASATPEDWWLGATYKGKIFLPLSTLPDKVVTKPGEKDVANTLRTTYTLPGAGGYDREYGYGSSSANTYDRLASMHPPLPQNPILNMSIRR